MRVRVDKTLEKYLLKFRIENAPDGHVEVPDELAEKFIAITNRQDADRPENERTAKGIAIAYSDFINNHQTPVHRRSEEAESQEQQVVHSAPLVMPPAPLSVSVSCPTSQLVAEALLRHEAILSQNNQILIQVCESLTGQAPPMIELPEIKMPVIPPPQVQVVSDNAALLQFAKRASAVVVILLIVIVILLLLK